MVDIDELQEEVHQLEEGLRVLEGVCEQAGEEIEELDERITQLEEAIGVDKSAPFNAEAEFRYAPDETTNEVIKDVIYWCQAHDKDTVPLQRLRRAVEYQGYTRDREIKKYTKRAVRHGPFRPHGEIASTWVVDPEAVEQTPSPEPAQS